MHRVIPNVQGVLDGDLAPFIAAYLKWKSAGGVARAVEDAE